MNSSRCVAGQPGRPIPAARKNPLYFFGTAATLTSRMKNLLAFLLLAVTLTVIAPLSTSAAPTLTPPPAAPVAAPAASPAPVPDPDALKWSAETLEYNPKPGEESAPFTFYVTNTTKAEISITALRTSCGCTVAQLPPLPAEPYKLGAGSNVSIGVTMDLRGKSGSVTKSITADTSVGQKTLLARVNLPTAPATPATPATPAVAQPSMDNRAKNIQEALADRQKVFKGDCASCHVEKGKGKMGQELYAASCGICHDSAQRAAMVPDLHVARSPRDIAFWQKWIMEGKPGTMMPAFAQLHGGPLTPEQIDSLTIYLYQTYPKAPTTTAALPAPSAAPSIVLPTPVKN